MKRPLCAGVAATLVASDIEVIVRIACAFHRRPARQRLAGASHQRRSLPQQPACARRDAQFGTDGQAQLFH
ncbi:UNVERIFIED_ORG: hypothetical protein ABIB63_002867 [Xanthomonas axonopodis]